jgi:hypothetical protein
VLPLQQPLGHDDALQTHSPVVVSHAWPAVHAPHVAPPVPHEVNVCDANASHVPPAPPLQQPCAQVTESQEHVPLLVSQSPLPQGEHAAPAAPHWVADCDE